MNLMIGVILAGGQSKRMGVDKAELSIAGRTMLDWVRTSLGPECEKVVVSGRTTDAGVPNLADPGNAHRGPLAGLVAAASAFPEHAIALVAVDQPWLRSDTIRRIGQLCGDLAAVPVESGIRQTTCAVYPPGVLTAAEVELAGGGSLQSLLDVVAFTPVVDWRTWGEDGRSWFSADTPELVARGLDRFGPPG